MVADVHKDPETLRTLGDISSMAIMFAALLKWLPAIAAIFSLIYSLIRIYESDTAQRFFAWTSRLSERFSDWARRKK